MNQRIRSLAVLVALLGCPLVVILTGCSRPPSSGIPAALNTNTFILKAGHLQGISLASEGHEQKWDGRQTETTHYFSATITSGTKDQLLTGYRLEVEHLLNSKGADIHGIGLTGTDFSYDYTWSGSDGIVRVYSFINTNDQIQIISFCHEHSQ